MTDFIRVAGAQLNLTVGDIDGNVERMLEAMAWAEECQADVLLFPELAITGYPPEDLLLRKAFVDANIEALHRLSRASGRPPRWSGSWAGGPGNARNRGPD